MLITCFFWGQRIVSVRSDWSDMFDEIFCLDYAHAGHTKKSPRDDGFSQGIMLSQSANVAIIGYLVQMSLNICTYICCGVSAFAKRHLIGAFYYYHSHCGLCRKVAEYATTSGYVIHFISAT